LTSGRFELPGLQRFLHLLAQLIEHLGLRQGRRLSRVAVSCGLRQSNRRIGVASRWRTSRDSRLNLLEDGFRWRCDGALGSRFANSIRRGRIGERCAGRWARHRHAHRKADAGSAEKPKQRESPKTTHSVVHDLKFCSLPVF
jgi:hypothetical protein